MSFDVWNLTKLHINFLSSIIDKVLIDKVEHQPEASHQARARTVEIFFIKISCLSVLSFEKFSR